MESAIARECRAAHGLEHPRARNAFACLDWQCFACALVSICLVCVVADMDLLSAMHSPSNTSAGKAEAERKLNEMDKQA